MSPEQLVLLSILRLDFSAFIQKVFNELNPASHFHESWFIRLPFEIIESIFACIIRRNIESYSLEGWLTMEGNTPVFRRTGKHPSGEKGQN